MNYKNCEVVLYFCGGINSYYQITQWANPLYELNKTNKVLFVITDKEVYKKVNKEHKFETYYAETFTNLIEFYDENSFPIVLYINNSLRNFQSLRYQKAYHIHLNHGESEKESMHSNQSKAYDYVFTVGQRGIERYKENLLNFDENKYISVGRPQLDFIKKIKIKKKKEQKVILYAPTWEATHTTMNYTSVKKYGLKLIKKLLEDENYIIIYKAHSALGTRDEKIKKYHKKIKRLVKKNKNAYNMSDEDINSIYTTIDFAFFDNSSVMIDYLHTLKPAAYLEIREDVKIEYLCKSFIKINDNNFKNFEKILKNELKKDSLKKIRKEIKKTYLGEFKEGESTKVFIEKINKIIDYRNHEIKNKL